MTEVERLLRYALVPVDPPGDLTERLERRLSVLTDAAVDELAGWDPSALRDPRRWARLIGAGVVAAGAGGALVLVRARREQQASSVRGLKALQKGVLDVQRDVGARLRRRR